MAKKKEMTWKVVREYKNLYSIEELIHRIIRKHLEFPDVALM